MCQRCDEGWDGGGTLQSLNWSSALDMILPACPCKIVVKLVQVRVSTFSFNIDQFHNCLPF